MNPNFLISKSEQELEALFAKDFIAHIDGKQATTLRRFYEEIADILETPDFSFNLEALSDALDDLQWLDDQRIVIYITNTVDFISKERDPAKMGSVLNVLDATAEDWKWDESDDKKEIIIVLEYSERIEEILAAEHIEYKHIAEL